MNKSKPIIKSKVKSLDGRILKCLNFDSVAWVLDNNKAVNRIKPEEKDKLRELQEFYKQEYKVDFNNENDYFYSIFAMAVDYIINYSHSRTLHKIIYDR